MNEQDAQTTSTRWPPARIAQWIVIASLLVVSEAVSLFGHTALSWGIDGVAVAVLVGFTLARRARRPDAPG